MLPNLQEMIEKLRHLAKDLQGDLHFDKMMRVLYATDASVYRELPLAVAIPKSNDDLKKLIAFANENQTSLIPRAAGTFKENHPINNGRNFKKAGCSWSLLAIRFILNDWERTRITGIVRNASVSSHPSAGAPFAHPLKIQSDPCEGSAPYVGPSRFGSHKNGSFNLSFLASVSTAR